MRCYTFNNVEFSLVLDYLIFRMSFNYIKFLQSFKYYMYHDLMTQHGHHNGLILVDKRIEFFFFLNEKN